MSTILTHCLQAVGSYGTATGGTGLMASLRQSLQGVERWIEQNPVVVAGIALAAIVLWKLLFGKRAVGR